MEKTNNFHITFQKLMMEEYAESLLGCKITINFFLLNVFCFYTLTSSCVSLSLIHSSIVIERHSALTLTRRKKKKKMWKRLPVPSSVSWFADQGRLRFSCTWSCTEPVSAELFCLLSQIKACMGSIPCAGCQSHLAGGPYVGNGPDMQMGIPPAFSSDAALVWGQILYLPSQEFQNGSQGLLKIGGLYFLVCFFSVHVCTWQK